MLQSMILNHGALEFSAWTAGFDDNPDAPIVICLHGFPDNARTFRYQLPALAAAGFRAVAPNMRGYEPGSQPADEDYSLVAIAGDVIAWADQLGADKVHLLGHDWGAAVTYVAGGMAPERFHSLMTIAVPHAARFADAAKQVPSQLAKSWYMMFFQLRGIAEFAMAYNDWALIRRLWKNWSPGYALSDEEWRALRETFQAPGVKKAMLNYYRQNATPSMLLGIKEMPAARFPTVPVPTLALTGADDGCIDSRLYDYTFTEQDFPAGYRVERIANAGHFAQIERPEEVNRLLLEWLAR
ncbi:MAG: alpha/beta fold hydrolase [Gammaproteobacteria bacterium]|nr:alpha/beta fold hydrolase [Gammaproteobacteria bacterium]